MPPELVEAVLEIADRANGEKTTKRQAISALAEVV
jgi:hypothetical protein